MAKIVKKESKVKVGMNPGYTPKLMAEPSETVNIPIWMHNGEIRYVSGEDFKWLVENKMEVSPASTSESPPSE
jgi:hypothetical protein